MGSMDEQTSIKVCWLKWVMESEIRIRSKRTKRARSCAVDTIGNSSRVALRRTSWGSQMAGTAGSLNPNKVEQASFLTKLCHFASPLPKGKQSPNLGLLPLSVSVGMIETYYVPMLHIFIFNSQLSCCKEYMEYAAIDPRSRWNGLWSVLKGKTAATM